MNDLIAKPTEGDLVFVIVCAIGGLVLLGYATLGTIEKFAPRRDDETEIAERIEEAIKDATGDLLDALKAIEEKY